MITVRQAKAIARYHTGIAKYLFIHIPKNAGLAIRSTRAFRRVMIFGDPYFHVSRDYTRELFEVMAREGYHHGAQHARLVDFHPNVRRRLQPVAFIRNPYARAYSRFTFSLQSQERSGAEVDYSSAAFEAFLETRHTFGNRPFFWHRAVAGWYEQLDYVTDETGDIPVLLLRHEALDEDIPRFLSMAAPARQNVSGVKAPHYRDVYTDAARKVVADWYSNDIEHFGFGFEGAATRNVAAVA